MASIQKFGGYTPEVRDAANAEAKKSRADNIRISKPGRVVVRLCPRPTPAAPFVMSHVHWVEWAAKKYMSFACPRLLANKPCPECEYEARLAAAGTDVDEKEAQRRSPQLTYYTNAILLGKTNTLPSEDDEDSVIIVQEMQFNDGVRKKIDALAEDNGDPWDVNEGYAVSFTVPEGGNQKDCVVGAVNKARALKLPSDGGWIQQLKSFSNRCKVYSPDEITGMMEGQRPGGNRSNRRALPAPGAAGGGSKRSIADDVDDDDSDD